MNTVSDNGIGGKVLLPLIDFNFIVDTDMGLIQFIKKNYRDKKVFKIDVLDKSDRELLSLLHYRSNINPLSVISTEECMCDIDDLYKSFFDNYKKDIVKCAYTSKKIFNFVQTVIFVGTDIGVKATISVKDDIESEKMNRLFKQFSLTKYEDCQSILSKDPFYVKDYSFFTNLNIENKVFGKKIYMNGSTYNKNFFESNIDLRLVRSNQIIIVNESSFNKGENNGIQ